MQTSCKPVPAGYYQNEFGTDNILIPYKKCPKGYVCQEPRLSKYYQICRVMFKIIVAWIYMSL